MNKIFHGKMEHRLKELSENLADAIVTDPPYGISFMGKHWDYKVPSVEQWKEAYRVLNPGGYLLAFGGTRTYHRMVVNIEDAGFEIRDQMQWIYSTGFPKSFNIYKYAKGSICNCKVRNNEILKHNMRSLSETDLPKEIGIRKEQGEVLQSVVPEQSSHRTMQGDKVEQGYENGKESCMERRSNDVQKEGELQKCSLQEGDRVVDTNGKKGRIHNGTPYDTGDNVQSVVEQDRGSSSQRPQSEQQQTGELGTLPNKRDSQENGAWQNCSGCGKPILPEGLGTALKPANEPICVARKPIEGTVADNILKYGTGGINIDDCRIPFNSTQDKSSATWGRGTDITGGNFIGATNGNGKTNVEANNKGRFPSNVIMDAEAGAILDNQTGILTSGNSNGFVGEFNSNIYGKYANNIINPETTYGDSGGASRFFYCPKPDGPERDKGLKGFTLKEAGIKNDSGRGFSETDPYKKIMRKNTHPTVKPIDLMRYLVRLVVKKGGIVLDPFCGSGSTLIAAKMELMEYIGIDMEEENVILSTARVNAWNPEKYIEQTLF